MCIYRDVRKSGAFHIPIKKNWVSHILFVEKRGPIIYLAVLKKGAIRHAHPYYAIYRNLPLSAPSPPPAPDEGAHVPNVRFLTFRFICFNFRPDDIFNPSLERAGFKIETWVPFAATAVQALLYGATKALDEICGTRSTLCANFKNRPDIVVSILDASLLFFFQCIRCFCCC